MKNADIFIGIYGNKLVSQVTASKNNGHELTHDYVVRRFLGACQLSKKTNLAKVLLQNQIGKSVMLVR